LKEGENEERRREMKGRRNRKRRRI